MLCSLEGLGSLEGLEGLEGLGGLGGLGSLEGSGAASGVCTRDPSRFQNVAALQNLKKAFEV